MRCFQRSVRPGWGFPCHRGWGLDGSVDISLLLSATWTPWCKLPPAHILFHQPGWQALKPWPKWIFLLLKSLCKINRILLNSACNCYGLTVMNYSTRCWSPCLPAHALAPTRFPHPVFPTAPYCKRLDFVLWFLYSHSKHEGPWNSLTGEWS